VSKRIRASPYSIQAEKPHSAGQQRSEARFSVRSQTLIGHLADNVMTKSLGETKRGTKH
jgi:hypothetical protein